LRVCCGTEESEVDASLAAHVVVALYDELYPHDEPHTPDKQSRTLSPMTHPPDDRSDDGLTAELREQLQEGALRKPAGSRPSSSTSAPPASW
jgi:hypothetical protein